MTDDPTMPALPITTGTAHHGTMLTLKQVAERLDISMATVRRHLKAGRYDGAVLAPGANGNEWQVPLATVESLLAVERTTAPTIQASAPPHRLQAELAALRQQVTELSTQVTDLNQRLLVEQAVSQERSNQLDELHATMRTLALTAGTTEKSSGRWRRNRGRIRIKTDKKRRVY